MKNKIIIHCIIVGLAAGMYSCKRDVIGTLNTGNFGDTTGTLKSAGSNNVGLAIEYGLSTSNPVYFATAAREANSVTFGNELKYGSVVQNDGSFNYTTADNFYTLCTNAGLQVYGHTLVWYSQQNTNYLAGITGSGGSSSGATSLLLNGGFETAGSGKLFANWSDLNHSNGVFSVGTGAANVHTGSSSLVATCVAGGNNYNTQILSDAFAVTAGKTYTITYWIKAASAGSIQFELRNNDAGATVSYVGGQPASTGWAQISYQYHPTASTLQLAFDLGGNANTFYIDDVSVIDAAAAAAAAPTAVANRVDSVLNRWITSAVTHYAGKIKAWDVVNEPMSDAGPLRTSTNTTIAAGATGYFFWSDYLGRQYALKAFQYAKAADPNALLFINEYNLESNNTKLDSLIAYVNELKAGGAKIDGIGTQLHISISTPYAGIDNAFRKLAATGLKIRISEMDVRLNPLDKTGFSTLPADPTLLGFQADMYKYVINSYFKYVPAAQRFGITVWGVDDASSWINTSLKKSDNPLLFDKNFAKKPAYSAFMQALKGQ